MGCTGWHKPGAEVWAVLASDLEGGSYACSGGLFFTPAKLSEKNMVSLCIYLMVRQKHRNEGYAEVTLALGWTPKPSCNFSVAQVQMSDIDKMEEINVFCKLGERKTVEMLYFPSYIITSTSSQEETEIYVLSAQ